MIRIVIGFLFILTGIFGSYYFDHYHGEIIPLPALWFVLSIILSIVGFVLIFGLSAGDKRQLAGLNKDFELLKKSGQKIEIDIDNCDFKNKNYQEEIISESFSRSAMLDALAGRDKNYSTQSVNRSYFIYHHKEYSKPERFVSPLYPMDETTLKFHILNQDILLYVDGTDRSKYYFELKSDS